MAQALKRTPLHELHCELGAKLTEFAGYEMPVQYSLGILGEHQHTRNKGRPIRCEPYGSNHFAWKLISRNRACIRKSNTNGRSRFKSGKAKIWSVSYTHLTLPTKVTV